MNRIVPWMAVAALVVIALMAPSSSGLAPKPPTWELSTPLNENPQGIPVDLYLSGPQNASFTLDVNAAPFNL